MDASNRAFFVGVVVTTCLGCDQASKIVASSMLKSRISHSFLGDLVRVTYLENGGAFLGLGAALPAQARFVLLTCTAAAALVLLFAYVCWRQSLTGKEIAGHTLILAGGTSNLVERATSGFVVDFLNVGFGNFRTGIFNLADVAILCGLVLVLLTTAMRGSGAEAVQIPNKIQ